MRRATIAAIALAIVPFLGACSDDGPSATPATTPSAGAVVATFQVADEQFKVELVTPELQEHARQLLAGDQVAPIPNGVVVRDDPGVNAPWTWHIDPATLEFADFTTGVCDGLPSAVEDSTVTSDHYCPWSAKVVAVDPA